ncbi:MAG: EamA family transporter [Pseudomonadota bacterium]
MNAELWAVLTAFCWGIGSLLEKKGVTLGGLAPVMGTTIRTAFSLLMLIVISFPFWGQLKLAGFKSISLIAIGGGFLAGGLGIVFLYTGLKTGNLSTVMTIAFCLAPVIGTILGILVLHEKLSAIQMAGISFCIIGSALLVYFKN